MLVRLCQILYACCVQIGASAPTMFRLRGSGPTGVRLGIGICLRRVLECGGGALPKFGQILSTRPDLLPEEVREHLAKLQDQMPNVGRSKISQLIHSEFSDTQFRELDLEPEASATIAQVHRAVRADDGQEVALKIMRPRVRAQIDRDCQLARVLLPLIGMVGTLRSIPMREVVGEVATTLRRQTDFVCESANLSRLRADFRNYPGILIPEVHTELCSKTILCMDYIRGLRKITDRSIPDSQARDLVRSGLHALYRMIFETGFLHCDLHPGNLQVAPDGRLVILDTGLMTELEDSTRRAFAEFFAAIALRRGTRAAEIIRATALRLPQDLNTASFDSEIADLVDRTGGLTAEHFNVASFVGELFAIQARHGILGTSRFSLIILALLVYEGTTKERYADLDFQQEAIPFVLGALITYPQETSLTAAAVRPSS